MSKSEQGVIAAILTIVVVSMVGTVALAVTGNASSITALLGSAAPTVAALFAWLKSSQAQTATQQTQQQVADLPSATADAVTSAVSGAAADVPGRS